MFKDPIFLNMAASILRRTTFSFLSSTNSSSLCKSHFSFSLYFSTERDSTAVTQFLINKHHFSPDEASQIASLTRITTEENADSLLSFLRNTGFSNAQLANIAKSSSHLFSAQLDSTIKPKFKIFRDLGFTDDEIVDIVSNRSRVLHYSAPKLLSAVKTLKGLLGSNAAVAKFLKAPGLFLRDMDNTLVPNIELLKSCGVSMKQMINLMCIPRFFLHKPENMRRFVERADELGCERGTYRFLHAVRVVSSMSNETWDLKVRTLQQLGFSDDDVMRTFKNSPRVFSSSDEKMKRVAKFLIESGMYGIECIANTPNVFQYSIEKRIRPRVKVLRVLENKKLIGNRPRLATMLFMTDLTFYKRFVSPHFDDVGELWSVVSGRGKVKLEEM